MIRCFKVATLVMLILMSSNIAFSQTKPVEMLSKDIARDIAERIEADINKIIQEKVSTGTTQLSIFFALDKNLQNEVILGDKVTQWLAELRRRSKSNYQFFIGKIREDNSPSINGRRMLLIMPSEYVRDSASDWDSFELFVGSAPSGVVVISTENYKRRTRPTFGGYVPSADWEFSSLSDNDMTNARLDAIATSIRSVAEGLGTPIPASSPGRP